MTSISRSRPSPAFVLSLIALFVALGGTGYAALTLPKNSVGSRQIKSNAVTSGKVRNGSLLSKDFKAGQLPAGARGAAGANGAAGLQGPKGADGQSITASSTLPSGQTESGVFAGSGAAAGYIDVAVNFVPHLAASLDASHTIRVTGASATHCPGVGQAGAGYFCLYETSSSGAAPNGTVIDNPAVAGTAGTDTRGADLFYNSTTNGSYVYGTWAVTAP